MTEVISITGRPKGVVYLPASKSVAHRALICASLAKGKSTLENLNLPGEDIMATLSCLQGLGVPIKWHKDSLHIEGQTLSPKADIALDAGESGSTLRFMIPVALLCDQPIKFTGRGRLWQRPQEVYLKELKAHGAKADFDQASSILTVQGPIKPGAYTLPGDISSQFISGLLMVLPLLEEDSQINLSTALESKPYVDLTISVMESFGVTVENKGYTKFIIPGGQSYSPRVYQVEGDFSAAAFFLGAAALGCDVSCGGLNLKSLQGDRAILDIIAQAGGEIIKNPDGTIEVKAKTLKGVTVNCRDIPDLVPPLAALLTFAQGESRLTQVSRLKMKESNRLEAITTQLNALGGQIIQEEDALIIKGVESLKGGLVDPYNDHRIAMSAALASLRSSRPVQILNPGCVNKSFPGFWEAFCQTEKESAL